MTIDRRTIPVTIRGKTYPSHQAAANALGITRAAVSPAKIRGQLDTVGLQPGDNATDGYIRVVMSDGRWRNASDIATRAAMDGMTIAAQGIGRSMARLVEEGFIEAEGDNRQRMWKLRRQEAAE